MRAGGVEPSARVRAVMQLRTRRSTRVAGEARAACSQPYVP
jgi:hypothetical protein